MLAVEIPQKELQWHRTAVRERGLDGAAFCSGGSTLTMGPRFGMLLLVSHARLLELLGLHANATRDEIKSRYRELARKFHPDMNGGDERSHARFRAIVAAAEELLADKADAPQRLERNGTKTTVAATAQNALDSNTTSRTHAPAHSSGGELARRRAELRTRLARCTRTLRRAQADVRDGDAKASAARGRGDEQMARHFERRVEADRSRVYALLAEIAGLENELHGLEAGPAGVDGEPRATRTWQESKLDPLERLRKEVQNVHDEERAALNRKHKDRSRRRP